MFPLGDFKFVFRGIANIAATMGYPFSKKNDDSQPSPEAAAGSSTSHPPSQADTVVERPPLYQQASLKRKTPHDGFDERTTQDDGYPHNLRNIYSPKRSRTPSSKPEEHANSANVVETLLPVPMQTEPTQPATLQTIVEIDNGSSAPSHETAEVREEEVQKASDSAPSTPSPPPLATAPVAPLSGANTETFSRTSTPPPSSLPATPPPALKPKPLTPSASAFTSPGFAAFAGSTSPFASVKKASDSKFRASLWNLDSDVGSSNEGSLSKNSLGSAFGEPDVQVAQESDAHAIFAAKPAKAAQPTTHATGEEEEDVEQEIKGVKLFVKRGNKPFASGMVGHLKLLCDRKTLGERLLFRREPLWQVSMNVRVHPATRCVYDAEENVIRLTLKETSPSAKLGGKDALELVIYALKPGRACSKQDFKEFAESLVNNAQFKQLAAAAAHSK